MSRYHMDVILAESSGNATALSPTTLVESLAELPARVYKVLSLPILRDWVLLFVIGAMLEVCRRMSRWTWSYLTSYMWISVTLDETDDCGHWLMFWLSRHNVFRSEYSLWYKYHYMTITRSTERGNRSQVKKLLKIKMLARDHSILQDLVLEANNLYHKESKDMISIYTWKRWWRVSAIQEKRPTSSIILDPGIIDMIFNDAKDFLTSKEWYAERGIPHRRGYLLYGAPGSGKTSLIHTIASELNLDVYILSLTSVDMDDDSLSSQIAELPSKCIVLVEDIDAAFHHGIKRNLADPEREGQPDGPEKARKSLIPEDGSPGSTSGITLSGLLNALDGIGGQQGRILFATTNDYRALDPALCRPGRLDLHIEFKLASKHQCRELFRRFYLPSRTGSGPDAHEREQEQEAAEDDEKVDLDTSTSTSAGTADTDDDGSDAAPQVRAMAHRAMKQRLSQKKAAELAEQFAAAIPHRSLSMATLQGYLMAYKARPYDAIRDLPAWIEKRLAEKREGTRSDAPAIVESGAPVTPPESPSSTENHSPVLQSDVKTAGKATTEESVYHESGDGSPHEACVP